MSTTPKEVENLINEHMVLHSRFEEKRDYLSISHISECPRRIYDEFLNGFEVSDMTHRMCYAGYQQEESIRDILITHGLIQQINVEVKAIDTRFMGHMDGLNNEYVIEIKSVSSRKWDNILKKNKCLWKHFVQVQLYMRYAHRNQAIVVYRNRETYEHKVFIVQYKKPLADSFEKKAFMILDCIDQKTPPICECGRCKS